MSLVASEYSDLECLWKSRQSFCLPGLTLAIPHFLPLVCPLLFLGLFPVFLSSAHVLEDDGSVFCYEPLTSFLPLQSEAISSCLSLPLGITTSQKSILLLHPLYLLPSWPLSHF